MTKQGYGRVVPAGPARTRYITIPADVAGDDRFPFKDGERVMITIGDHRSILITPGE